MSYTGLAAIYDEPSLPEPVYQEINLKARSGSDTNIAMKGNNCYNVMAKNITTTDSTIILNECPAYDNCKR